MKNSVSLDDLDKKVVDKFKGFIVEAKMTGYDNKINSTLRDSEYQNYLYGIGRTTPGKIVTNAKGGESYHNYGYAVDITFTTAGKEITNEDFDILVVLAQKYGITWGGMFKSFVDKPHWQVYDKTVYTKIEVVKKKMTS